MYTSLIQCDACPKKESDPLGWFQVLVSGDIETALSIQRLDPARPSQSRWPQYHLCSEECLIRFVIEWAKDKPKRKPRKGKPEVKTYTAAELLDMTDEEAKRADAERQQ